MICLWHHLGLRLSRPGQGPGGGGGFTQAALPRWQQSRGGQGEPLSCGCGFSAEMRGLCDGDAAGWLLHGTELPSCVLQLPGSRAG